MFIDRLYYCILTTVSITDDVIIMTSISRHSNCFYEVIDKDNNNMGLKVSKVKKATAAAFRAVDKSDVSKLAKAMANGATVGGKRSSSSSSSSSNTHEMSLLEYAVEKDWLGGVALMLKVCLSLSLQFYTVSQKRETLYACPYLC